VLHIQYEVEQTLFQGQFGQSPINVVWFFDGLRMTNDGGDTSCANSSNLVKLKLVKDLNKLGMAHMVVKTFCPPMLSLIDCPTLSSNSVVKNSKVLTYVIATCIAI
jgi:hypothetical protein